MKHLFISILLITGISIGVFAQEKSRKELRGDKYYTIYAFDKAVDFYSHTKQLSMEGQRRLAESYHNLDKNMEAEITYSKLISNSGVPLAEDYYSYAMILKINGKYDNVNNWMDKFTALKPNDLRAKSYTAHKNELPELLKDQGNFKITQLDVNTSADDFGTCYYKDKIVFSSSRAFAKMIVRKDNWSEQPYLDMYVSDLDGIQLKKPEIFHKNLDGKLNDGPASFSNDGTYMAFTSNNYDVKRKDKIVRIEIYFSSYSDGKWSKPEPFFMNNKDYSVGHPCLMADGKTMYFSCDMPGGFGKADIYKISKDEKGVWGRPENMGDKINTEGDELFPFYEPRSETLFFTSNGQYGLGGLDIFMCAVKGKEVGNIQNVGFPLNTQHDDFALMVNGNVKTGYFSSNRTGANGDDDIYAVDILKMLQNGKRIEGVTKNPDGTIIPNTFITLIDDKGEILDTLTTKDDGVYTFFVASDKQFKVTGKKQDYTDGFCLANTLGKELIIKADIILSSKKEVVEVKINLGADLGKILKFNPDKIYFDVDKFNIRPDAETELAYIIKIMNDFPTMQVELRAHTDCRETMEYNQILSDKRAQSSADYIKRRISNPSRIYGKGYGETRLVNNCACEGDVVSNCTSEEQQKNRRTEFIIVKQ
jgi:outer membrane protein OmpA-like peptidoglycan-associated protein/Tol biopolymer transport system component